jgi:predicted negative regulator of RcsB-dependent stress response
VGQSQEGKPRMKHIPAELLPEVKLWVGRYQEARKMLDEVSNENWKKIIRHTKRKP